MRRYYAAESIGQIRVVQLIMRLHSLYGNWRFITVLMCVGHSTLCFARWIQSTPLLSTSLD